MARARNCRLLHKDRKLLGKYFNSTSLTCPIKYLHMQNFELGLSNRHRHIHMRTFPSRFPTQLFVPLFFREESIFNFHPHSSFTKIFTSRSAQDDDDNDAESPGLSNHLMKNVWQVTDRRGKLMS